MTEGSETTDTTNNFRPVKPTLGDVTEIGTNSWAAWTGGEPLPDWSGLKDPTPGSISPNQYRPTGISSRAKSQAYRVKGLETKFTRDSDLHTFEKKIMKHLVQYGLDTITYLQDPADNTQVVSVITNHARFNLKSGASKAVILYNTMFDSYDKDNDRDAKDFLMNSISDDLETQLYENCNDDDPFSVYWLNLIHIVKSVSIDRFDKIKDRIKARKIKDYPSENVELIATDFLNDWKELHGASLYDHNLTMTMLNAIMAAGGTENEDFRYPLREIKQKLNTKLLNVRHYDYSKAHKSMIAEELDVQSVLKAAKNQYRELLDGGKWPAAAHAKDSKAMNKNFGNVNKVATDDLRRMVNALVQSATASSGNKGKGNGFQKGQNRKPDFKGKKFNSRDKSARNNPKKNLPAGPKPGESEIKFIDGTKRYWCAKCNRWTISHTTDQHKSKEELQANNKGTAGMTKLDFDFHPSAYFVSGPRKASISDWLSWLMKVIKCMIMIIILGYGYVKNQDIVNMIAARVYGCLGHTADVTIDIGMNLMTAIQYEWYNNVSWIWLIMTTLIFLMGVGVGWYVHKSLPEETTRYRSGANVIKQYRRRHKERHTSRRARSRRPRPTRMTPDMIQPDRVHHERFRNIARPHRYEHPNVERIRVTRVRIATLKNKIQQVELYLEKLKLELRGEEALLSRLLEKAKELSRQGTSVNRQTKTKATPNKATQNKVKPVHNKSKQKRDAREKKKTLKRLVNVPKGKRVYALKKLINLSSLSSSKNKPMENEMVLFDSGANICVTNQRDDFVAGFTPSDGNGMVDGIGKALSIKGQGQVAWTFKADNGMYRTLVLPAYYIPTSNARIASLQVILQTYSGEFVSMTADELTLSGDQSVPSLTIPISSKSNLPLAQLHSVDNKAKVFKVAKKSKEVLPTHSQPSLTTAKNINLSEPEKEILRWHYRLGHIGMKRIQWLFRQGILSSSEKERRRQSAATQLNSGPLCTACQYAKQRRKTTPGTIKKIVKKVVDTLKQNHLFPGSETSVDHFHCNPLGRLLHTYGKEPADAKYKGGAIFTDHATGYTHVELQTSLNSHHTLRAKQAYDMVCDSMGVVPQRFLSDNGTSFVNKEFEAHLKQFHQTIRHSSVGAHHSNGIAERQIATVTSIARAMMHHQAIHWPDVADVELWPLALLHAVYILNRIPKEDSGRSPLELFSRKTWPSSKFHDFHVWGCPVYVLDHAISDGKKLPRWKPRSSRCMYVGHSAKHGHSVPLVLNLDTGKITPQYHVIFDDWFQTVDASSDTPIDFDNEDWYETFGTTTNQYVSDETPSEAPEDLPPPTIESEGVTHTEALREVRDQQREPPAPLEREHEPTPRSLPSTMASPLKESTVSQEPLIQRETKATTPKSTPPPADSSHNESSPGWFDVEVAPPQTSQPKPTHGWSDVEHASPRKVHFRPDTSGLVSDSVPSSTSTSRSGPITRSRTGSLPPSVNYVEAHSRLYEQLYVGKAVNTDPDTYTWDEAMASPYKQQFLEAAQEEIDSLVGQTTWKEDLKTNATTRIIPATWTFRIKRTADGTIKKFKARMCLRGDLQEDNGRDNFSPVAAWSTVRGFMVWTTVAEWVQLTIDFSNAFVQSYLPEDEPVWMHIPRGYKSTNGPDYCLKLIKSLYGHRRAPQLWFNHSGDAFKKLGLRQSKHDPCLWYGKDIMIVQYVDDCGISAPTRERIDQFIEDLRQLGFALTVEGSFSEFLGIKFDTKEDGSIECTQKGLIAKTLEAAGMTDCNPNSVPALQATLGADKDGEPMNESWNYRAICGMLLYLSTNTRPDIALAVSQVCRHGHNPKKSHASAVKTILRYLKKTANKGMIIKPNNRKLNLDLYVDADFCGLFGREDPRDPNSVRSRTGYIVILCGWPIIWKSQLQSYIAQSTCESEYGSLAAALRVFLPFKQLIMEMIAEVNHAELSAIRLHATVFEDNQSAYYLATNQRLTSRTKYFLAKWHWFWDAYNRKEFAIVKCPTDLMNADYLTKPLPKVTFEANRERVQGW